MVARKRSIVAAMLLFAAIGVSGQDAPTCVVGSLTQMTSPASFQKVTPGETVSSDILIENHNPQGCPAAAVILTAESAAPIAWVVALDGGTKWVIHPGAKAFTRLHISVPKDATSGSVVVNYTLEQYGVAEPYVLPIVVNVRSAAK